MCLLCLVGSENAGTARGSIPTDGDNEDLVRTADATMRVPIYLSVRRVNGNFNIS